MSIDAADPIEQAGLTHRRGPASPGRGRRYAGRGLLLASALAVLAACDRSEPTDPGAVEGLASFDVSLPATVTESEPFTLSVTAVGSRGTRPFAGFSGQVELSLAGGSGAIEPAVLPVTGGTGSTGAAVIRGVTGAVTVRATHDQAAGSAGTAVEPRVQAPDTLTGPPNAPANEHIPEVEFADPDPDDFTDVDGVPISRRTLLLIFEPDVTVARANALLTSLEAEIIGAFPAAALLYLRVPDRMVEAAFELVDELLDDDRVAAVTLDVAGLETQQLPPHNVGALWRWDVTDPPGSGNWGLKRVRAPQLWNLHTFVQRNRAAQNVCAAAVEGGAPDTAHPDLTFDAGSPNGTSDHFTMVAGVMGADWGNRLGVEGVNPWLAPIIARSAAAFAAGSALSNQLHLILNTVLVGTCVKVVNRSMGWSTPHPSQAFVDNAGNLFHQAVTFFALNTRSDFALTFSAGNAGVPQTRTNSAGANAAVRFGGRYFAVEAITPQGGRAGFSNRDGSVSAPGQCVRSTEANNQNNYDRADCPWRDGVGDVPVDHRYATQSGTSFAAPLVAGIIAALWKLEPALTVAQIRQLITDARYTRNTTGGSRPSVDAFAAAMGIDVLLNRRDLQRALVDVDDGTPDGNLRQRVFDDDPDPDRIHTADRRRGDGDVNMRDFRAFRDAVLEVIGPAGDPNLPILLDGPFGHFKRDLNKNGCVHGQPASPANPLIPSPADCTGAPGEDEYSRYDFNGNGLLDWNTGWTVQAPVAPFKIDPDTQCQGVNQPAGCLRDVDVMIEVWDTDDENVRPDATDDPPVCNPPAPANPPAGWSATGLMADRNNNNVIDYFSSADLHVRADAADPDAGLAIRSGSAGQFRFFKCRHEAFQGVVTVPVYPPGGINVSYTRTVDLGFILETRAFGLIARAVLGEDLGLVLGYDKLDFFSTDRGRGPAVFPRNAQLESLTRPSNPDGVGAYGIATAPDQDQLEIRMFELAEQIILPQSLLAEWLGGAELIVPGWTERCIAFDFVGCSTWEGQLWGALMTARD